MIRCNIKTTFKKFFKGKEFCFYILMFVFFFTEKKPEMAACPEDLWRSVTGSCGQ